MDQSVHQYDAFLYFFFFIKQYDAFLCFGEWEPTPGDFFRALEV